MFTRLLLKSGFSKLRLWDYVLTATPKSLNTAKICSQCCQGLLNVTSALGAIVRIRS